MSDEVYHRLAKVLDTLPNGFPSTEGGVEIKLLKKIFSAEEADLFCDMRLSFETAAQVAERAGRPLEGLEERLAAMRDRGQLWGLTLGNINLYKMMPWLFGIYEMQLRHIDQEMAELFEEYYPVLGEQFFKGQPQQFQIIPIEKEIPNEQEALPYEKVSGIIETSKSFMVQECICKKEKHLMDEGCDKPLQVCMAFAPVEGIFDNASGVSRPITKQEAFDLLDKAEEAGLVHLTHNMQNGLFYICNCCGCCCGVLSAINRLGINATEVVNSHYYAEIDPDLCTVCNTCVDERCQVNAIEEGEDFNEVIRDKCIGCGLCVTTCPSEAIQLVRKAPEELTLPPQDEASWFEERGQWRGVDFSMYK
ncbi:MAG: 4Fe-4S binding protein [Deltaproteobacteria bacterium]|nr:4Fe-4S binding protein [Deltaproteobacteria bacterium]